jgi:predicted dehydrogenase
LDDFVTACRDQREPAIDGEYGRSVIATARAIYASSELGEQVTV